MGLFSWLKGKKDNKKYERFKGLLWRDPIYGQFGSNIYASDVVQQAIQCIVREMKKLTPQHVIRKDSGTSAANDEIQAVLDNPNPMMTTSDFLEKVVWQLMFNYNSFVLPTWEGDRLTGLFPLQPTRVEFLKDATGKMYIELSFSNGQKFTLDYSEVIHIRHNYSVSEFMGGNENGQPDNKALLKSLELNDVMLNGVGKALKSSFSINGVVKYNTLLDGDKTETALKELTDRLNNNESGFMPLDLKGEFIPFQRQIQMVDPETLKFIDEKILRNFGVPVAILTGDYTKSQYEAFFQKTLEPIIVSLSQAFTKAIFSRRESFGFGHKIIFFHNLLDFMTMQEKIQFATLMSNTGSIMTGELRNLFGLPPFEDDKLNNTPVMSKNFGDANAVKDDGKSKNDDDSGNLDKNKKKNDNNKDGEEEDEDEE